MVWLVGGYLLIGILKAFRMLGQSPAAQPQWAHTSVGLSRLVLIVIYAALWPLHPR